jgi:hypothetical protein
MDMLKASTFKSTPMDSKVNVKRESDINDTRRIFCMVKAPYTPYLLSYHPLLAYDDMPEEDDKTTSMDEEDILYGNGDDMPEEDD